MNRQGGKLLAAVLEQHSQKYRNRLKACRRRCDETAVHDARTAARRLLSLLELLRAIRPEIGLDKLRRRIKAQLDAFDELRDTQVMLLEIAARVEALPALAPFLHDLRRREQQLLTQAAAYIKSRPAGPLRRQLKKAGHRCRRQLKGCDLRVETTKVINILNAAVGSRRQAADPRDLTTIHHLRIAVKKLRYTVAAVQSLLPDYPLGQYDSLPAYLTLMGNIQNSAVLIRALEQYYLQGVPADVRAFFQQQQQALLEEFENHDALWH
ncbi:MAG: CHAD domain-containing protein [Methylococcales bacterium]|nr:CHAD domain-containing protein [Methylococcales bacterium]